MTDQELRTIIVESLEYANVTTAREQSMAFLSSEGREDISLNQLGMDSLAVMELCIAIEVNTGVSIVPDDLQKVGTLNNLIKSVQSQLK